MQIQCLTNSFACVAQNVAPKTIAPAVSQSAESNPIARIPAHRPAPQNALIRFAVLNALRPAVGFLRLLVLSASFIAFTSSQAAPVTLNIVGHLTLVNDSSNQLPGLTVGMPFTGTLQYDPALTRPPSDIPSPHTEYYRFTNAAGFSFTLQVGSHTFTGTAVEPMENGIVMYDDYDMMDRFLAFFNPPETRHNGNPPPSEYTYGGIGLTLIDTNRTAFTSDALPAVFPDLDKFTSHYIDISLSKSGEPNLYYVVGTITAFTASFQPQLNIRVQPNGSVQLAWPLAANDFVLETRDHPHTGTWTPVVQAAIATEHEFVVNISATDTSRFFRLARINP